jgi:hypothetical protein
MSEEGEMRRGRGSIQNLHEDVGIWKEQDKGECRDGDAGDVRYPTKGQPGDGDDERRETRLLDCVGGTCLRISFPPYITQVRLGTT